LKGLKFGGLAGAVNLSGDAEGGLLRLITLMTVDNPQKLRALTKKYAETVGEIEAAGTKTEVTYKADAEKVGKTSIDLVTTKITINDDAPNAEQQKQMIKLLYGEEGNEARTAYLKDKIVQVMGGGAKAMESALKAVETPAKTPAASLAAVKAKLGTKPNFIGLIDVASAVVKGLGVAKEFGGDELPFDPAKLTKGLTLKPSYLGFGVEVQDAAVSVKTVVPVDQIKSLVQLGMKAQAAAAGGGDADGPEEKTQIKEKDEDEKDEKKSDKDDDDAEEKPAAKKPATKKPATKKPAKEDE
jgi:hypothetical protein